MPIFGYLRVSSQQQDLSLQRDALTAAGCEKLFEEKVTGTSIAPRKELQKLLKRLQPGDTLICHRLDRLCRNMKDLVDLMGQLSDKQVHFRSLKEEWATLDNAHGKLLLHILGAVATFEAALIRARTEEGRARYVANGGKLGRRSKLNDKQRRLMLAMLGENKTQDEIAAVMGVTQQTISYQLKLLQ